MRLILPILLGLTCQATPGFSDSCPEPRDIRGEMAALLSSVQAAGSEREAAPIVGQMWALWKQAPDARAQALLQQGSEDIRLTDYGAAEVTLSELIAYCPAYAEGYNQRAFARYLSGRFDLALADLDEALLLSPNHVAAMAGKVLTLHALGQFEAAQEMLRMALKLNPWLPERHMLRRLPGIEL